MGDRTRAEHLVDQASMWGVDYSNSTARLLIVEQIRSMLLSAMPISGRWPKWARGAGSGELEVHSTVAGRTGEQQCPLLSDSRP